MCSSDLIEGISGDADGFQIIQGRRERDALGDINHSVRTCRLLCAAAGGQAHYQEGSKYKGGIKPICFHGITSIEKRSEGMIGEEKYRKGVEA